MCSGFYKMAGNRANISYITYRISFPECYFTNSLNGKPYYIAVVQWPFNMSTNRNIVTVNRAAVWYGFIIRGVPLPWVTNAAFMCLTRTSEPFLEFNNAVILCGLNEHPVSSVLWEETDTTRTVTGHHSSHIISQSGVIDPVIFGNATSVGCFKSSLIRDLDINDLISKSHYYDRTDVLTASMCLSRLERL